jgi:HD-GYP domain-containing protein (c-di-GMP phosphodiesterase class II)
LRRFQQIAYTTDKMWLKFRWGLLAIWAVVAIGNASLAFIAVCLALGIVSGLLVMHQTRDFETYRTRTHSFPRIQRLVDTGLACGGCVLGGTQFSAAWLIAVPIVIFEGVCSRNVRSALATALLGAGIVCFEITNGIKPIAVVIPVISLLLSAGVGYILSVFQTKDRILHERDRRLSTVLNTASNLAASSDLKSLILGTLKSAVHDIGATAGIVGLVSEEDKNLLITEAAYSSAGDFYFPLNLSLGEGVSGYVAKMGQPITLTAQANESLECDQIGLPVKAAVSIPLINREFTGSGIASNEAVIGAMTIINSDVADTLDAEELDLLQSLASLLANAIYNARMEERSRATFLRTLESLATALEARDDYTRGHSQRVCDLSGLIGAKLGLLPDALEELRIGTILHDIGKIGVPDAILNKPGRLTDEEFGAMKAHPVIGYEICKPLMLSEGVLMIIRNHHEKLDGSGYPDGLKGGELPLSLRIVCVADAFDAMSSRRPYRAVMDIGVVMGELSKGAGIQFDPVVVEALKQLLLNHELDDLYAAYWKPDAVDEVAVEGDAKPEEKAA